MQWLNYSLQMVPVGVMNHKEYASLARFERATYRLGGGCSIHLSYKDML